MASINKLSIRGVRAFSPEDQEQVIEFYFPVTVIVGANGCGKTTIIESLKYAVTGSLPPGNKSGQAFVHDPKSIGSSAVKANVKLRFTNRAGSQMVVVRSMEVTQKKTTMSFKALDGILRTTDARTGERVSMSHKCTELDRQIPLLLGVSKPILEHVVFCHQEDSSWPLMEGAVLKKRFDDIFDSTRYAKALKAIQETKKEYTGIVKELKADLSGLASHKHAAKGFRQELTSFGEQLEELEEDLEARRKEIKEVETEMNRNAQIAEQVEELNCELEDKRTQLDKELAAEGMQRSVLTKDLTQTRTARELKDMLRDFDNEVGRQLERQGDLEREVRVIHSSMERIQQDDKSQREKIGTLTAQKVAHDKMLKKRLAKMDKMAEKYSIELPVTQTQNTSFVSTQNSFAESVGDSTVLTQDSVVSVTVEDMHQFLKALEEKEADLKQTLRNYTDQSQQQADAIQDELNEMTAQSKSIEHKLKKLEKEQNDGRAEISTLNSQVPTHSRMRKNDIEETRRQAAHYAKERDKATNDDELADIPAKIRSYEGQIDVLKRQIEYDNRDLRELRKNTDAQNSITVLKEQAATELENLQESLKEHEYTFQKFGLASPEALPGVDGEDDSGDELVEAIENVTTAIQEKFGFVQQELSKVKDDEVSKQRIVSEKSALLAHSKQNLASLRGRLDALGGDNGSMSKYQRTVSAIRQFEQTTGPTTAFQGTDPQAVLAHLTTRIEEIEKSASDCIQPEVLAKILDQICAMSVYTDNGQQKVHCPCCTREFADSSEAQTFKDALARMKNIETSELLRANMQQVERSRETKAEFQRWRKAVSETMHDVLDWNRMTTEMKDTQVAIEGIESDLSTRQTELSTLQAEIKDLQSNADELRETVDASKRWTEDAARLSRKKMEIGQKKVDLSISTSTVADRDLDTVESDLVKHQSEKDDLNNKIADLNKKMSALNTKIATFSSKATQFEKLARDKQAKYEEEQKANIRKAELQKRLAVIGDEIPKFKSQVQQGKQKIRAKEGDRNRFRQSVQEEERNQREHLHKFQSDVNSLRQMTAEIDSYAGSNNEAELDQIQQKLSALDDKMKQKKSELAVIEPELDAIKKKKDQQNSEKTNIEGNLHVLEIRGKIAAFEKDIQQMEKERSAIEGYSTYAENLQNLQDQVSKLHESRAHHEGRRGGIIEQIRSLKRKLKTPEYKDIDERHRIVVIKHETTQIAVSDLDKYHSALDNALLRYHGIKIAEINRIIRELWNLTYKGEDISNIELVSGQEKNARKSYNYRVVMSKGNTKLDMRGRCSAGQRVLASIVIRLALAETFCVNFGCIALDEPTVNLDYNNKRGLAIALAQIIASRSQQRNFQLVVITHDEEFVTMMKTELASQSGFSMPEKYFAVRREEAADGKHYSKIDAIDWDELV